jgi:hypothetical protein
MHRDAAGILYAFFQEREMKQFIAASLFGLFALGASAQSVTDGNTVTINGAGPAITLPAEPRIMSAQEFGKFVGSYELANGKTLSLFVRGDLKFAAIKGEASHVLVAKSGNTFVAKDKQLAVTIDLHENSDVTGEVLIAAAGERLADGKTDSKVVRVAFH